MLLPFIPPLPETQVGTGLFSELNLLLMDISKKYKHYIVLQYHLSRFLITSPGRSEQLLGVKLVRGMTRYKYKK